MHSSARLKSAANLTWQVALLSLIVLAVLGLRPGQVSGISMQPRIDSDDYVVINALAFRFGTPARNDIVAFRHERSAPSVYLKRVIGLPGDRIAIDRGIVRVDGAIIAEPYAHPDTRSFPEVVVPANCYYVLGDNRANSDDSRAWGFVPADQIVGRATFVIWPFSHVRVIR